jgi:Zn-finger nucleic acid-binding protein
MDWRIASGQDLDMERKIVSPQRQVFRKGWVHECPRDRTSLVIDFYQNHSIRRCRSCAGLWIPASVVSLAVGRINAPRLSSSTGRCCPDGGARLLAVSRKKVEVDVCASCGGVWLDAGELQRVLKRQQGSGVMETVVEIVPDGLTGIPDVLVGAGELAGDVVGTVLEFLGEALSGL